MRWYPNQREASSGCVTGQPPSSTIVVNSMTVDGPERILDLIKERGVQRLRGIVTYEILCHPSSWNVEFLEPFLGRGTSLLRQLPNSRQ